MAAGSTANGTNVQTHTSNSSAAQKFRLYNLSPSIKPSGVEVDEGFYCIQSKKDANYYVNLDAGSSANGANIHLWSGTAGSNDNQIFYFKKTSDGFYEIKNCNTKKAIDVFVSCVLPGTNVLRWQCKKSAAQKWKVSYDTTGYMTLTNVGSNKVLDVAGETASVGNNVCQYTSNGSYAQKWIAVPIDSTSGKYKLISGLSDSLQLGAYSSSIGNGTNICLQNMGTSSFKTLKFLAIG